MLMLLNPLQALWHCIKPRRVIRFEVPVELYQEFLDYLDSSQSCFTEDMIENSSNPRLKPLIELIDGWLGDHVTPRFATRKELEKAINDALESIPK